MIIIMGAWKKRRVIVALRAQWPGKWQFVPPNLWFHEGGWHVYRCAAMCGPTDDDFAAQYRRSDTGEVIVGLPT